VASGEDSIGDCAMIATAVALILDVAADNSDEQFRSECPIVFELANADSND
jgi:hypothetical protein